jgi:hypothetical protein
MKEDEISGHVYTMQGEMRKAYIILVQSLKRRYF